MEQRKNIKHYSYWKRIFSFILAFAMIVTGVNVDFNVKTAKAYGDGPAVSYKNKEVMLEFNANTMPAGYTLESGNIYHVRKNTTFAAVEAGTPGLRVKEGDTVIIYIDKNAALECRGAAGNGVTGGAAGILVQESSTLIVTGDGALITKGGNGSAATNGGNGGNGAFGGAKTGGNGGAGGRGAAGAGAGIGTNGGNAGQGAVETVGVTEAYTSGDELVGNNGSSGAQGSAASVAGNVYLLGNITVNANAGTGGAKGSAGTAGSGNTSVYHASLANYDEYAGGGGAGGGGSASADAAAIGSGSTGGTGGSSGGSGGVGEDYDQAYLGSNYNGGNGQGGIVGSATYNGNGTKTNGSYTGNDRKGGNGGSCSFNSFPENSQGGSVTIGSYATLNGKMRLGIDETEDDVKEVQESLGGSSETNKGLGVRSTVDTHLVTINDELNIISDVLDQNVKLSFNANGGYGDDYVTDCHNFPETITITDHKYSGKQIIGYTLEKDLSDVAEDKYYFYRTAIDDRTHTVFKGQTDSFEKLFATLDFDAVFSGELSFYAQWEDAEYRIGYYKTSNDTKPATITEEVYGKFLVLTRKQAGLDAREGYTFLGWTREPKATEAEYKAGKQYNGGATVVPGEIVPMYPVWSFTGGYTIDYDGNGSDEEPAYNIPAASEVLLGEDQVKGDEIEYKIEYAVNKDREEVYPQRDGYTFLGWSTEAAADPENIYAPGEKVPLTGNTVFYAQWKKNPKLTYEVNGGELEQTIPEYIYQKNDKVKVGCDRLTYEYDKDGKSTNITWGEPVDITREGYTFLGWVLTETVTTGKKETSYYYNKKENTWVKITDENKDTYMDSKDALVESGDTFAMPDDDSSVTTDVVVTATAKWKKKTNTARFYFSAYTAKGKLKVYDVNISQNYSVTNKGITDKKTEIVTKMAVEISEDYVTEKFDDIKYDATLDFDITVSNAYNPTYLFVYAIGEDFGVNLKPYMIKRGDNVISADEIIENPTSSSSEPYTFFYRLSNIKKEVVIYTIYAEQYEYNIKYVDPSDVRNEGESEDGIYYAGYESPLLDSTKVTSDDYDFVGWYESEEEALKVTKNNDGVNTANVVTHSAVSNRGDKTYYAAWQGKKYTITYYKANYNSNIASGKNYTVATTDVAVKRFGETFEISKNEDVEGPNNAVFLGWATSPDATKAKYAPGETVKDVAKSETKAISLYAVWDISNISITYDAQGGSFKDGSKSKTYVDKYKATASQIYENSGISSLEPNIKKDGYAFMGWAFKPDSEVPTIAKDGSVLDMIKDSEAYEDVTAYAVWRAKSYTLQYYKDNEGNEISGVTTVKYGDTITIGYIDDPHQGVSLKVPVTTPEGKTLLGWAPQKGTSTIWYLQGEKIVVSSDVPYLYPVFTDSEKYTLAYNANGGTWTGYAPYSIATAEESTVNFTISNVVPERAGYTFLGWTERQDATEATFKAGGTYSIPATVLESHNYVLYAVWSPVKYKITFKPGNPATTDAVYKNAATASAVRPTLKSQTFDDPSLAVDDSDTTKQTYTQTFTYDKETKLAKAQYEYPGYDFVGWSETPDGEVIAFTDAQVVKNLTDKNNDIYKTLYAVWKVGSTIKVVYKGNGNTSKDKTVPEDENYVNVIGAEVNNDTIKGIEVELAEPKSEDSSIEREGYKFMGWTTDYAHSVFEADETIPATAPVIKPGETDIITDSTTYYAVWQAYKTYKVTYDLNGSIGKVPVDNKTYCEDGKSYDGNEVKVLFSPISHRYGYDFLGWTTTPQAVTKQSVEATYTNDGINEFEIKEDTTLYAVWAAHSYTIEYYDYRTSTTPVEKKKVYYNQEVKLATGGVVTPEKGYCFKGWSTVASGNVVFKGAEAVRNITTSNNVKLYAVYGPKTYRIVLDDDVESYTKYLTDYKKNHFTQATVVGTSEEKEFEREYEDGITEEKYTVINKYPTYEIEFKDAFKDITIPSVYGFDFGGYEVVYGEESVEVYDNSGNAVSNLNKKVIGEDTAEADEDGVADIVLKAMWIPHEFDVVFMQDDKQVDSTHVTYGDPFVMPKSVKNLSVSNDYTVAGWTTNVDDQYPATVDVEDTVMFKADTTYPADDIAKLYNNGKAAVILYPVYKTTVKYNVRFVAEDATNVPETQKVAYQDNFELTFDDVVLKTPKREGYIFVGWSTEEDIADEEIITYPYEEGATYTIEDVSEDIVLYAEFVAIDYFINYIDGDEVADTDCDMITYPCADSETEAAYTFRAYDEVSFSAPKGYKLLGWSLKKGAKADAIDFYPGQKLDRALKTELGDEVNLYPVWGEKNYTVIFDANNEEAFGTTNKQVMTYDQASALNKNQFRSFDYSFQGWSTVATSSAVEYHDAESVDLSELATSSDDYVDENSDVEVTLYAVWMPEIEEKEATITYGDKLDVSTLFIIPALAGEATYHIPLLGTDASIDGTEFKYTKAGVYPVLLITNSKDGIGYGLGYTTITVEKAQAAGTIILDNKFDYSDIDKIAPEIKFTNPLDEEDYSPEITFEYKVAGEDDETYDADINEVVSKPGTYVVRATVADTDNFKGFTVSKKFKISNLKFASVVTPAAVEVGNGAAKTAEGLNLPETVKIVLEDGSKIKADVTWDTASVTDYDRGIKYQDQTFTVNGTVDIPDTVRNVSEDEITTSIEVTVLKDENNLDEVKSDLITNLLLNAYNVYDNYDEAEQDEITKIVKETREAIIAAESESEAMMAYAMAFKRIELLTTSDQHRIEELDEKIDVTSAAAIEAINNTKEELDEKINDTKEELDEKIDVTSAAAIEAINNTKEELDGKIDDTKEELDGKIDDTKEELDGKIDDTKEELDGKVDDTKEELDGKIDDTKEELNDKIDGAKDELDKKVDDAKDELDKKVDDAKNELDKKVDDTKDELDNAIDNAVDSHMKDVVAVASQAAIDRQIAKENADAASKSAAQANAKADAINAKTTAENTAYQNELALNAGLKVSQTGSQLIIEWGKVAGADGYKVFVQYCGKAYTADATSLLTGDATTSVVINSLNGKKLKLKKNFKLYVVAYKTVNGKEEILCKSIAAHVVGRKNKKYTNAESIVVDNTSISLTTGASEKIKAKTKLIQNGKKKKKQLSNKHAKEFRYAVSDKTVVSVDKNGVVTALAEGECTVYVYSRNGLAVAVKVKVTKTV